MIGVPESHCAVAFRTMRGKGCRDMVSTARKTSTKRERVETRLTSDQKALVQRAAAITGRSVSDFILTSATERAAQIIDSHQVIRLSAEDSLFFAEVVLNPAEPGEALGAAA